MKKKRKRKKILWVEDDAWAIQGLMLPIIHSGVEVEIVETYTDALEKLEIGEAFDAFVVDLILPLARDAESDISTQGEQDKYLGVSLVKEIKARWPEAPVFVLTVVSDDAVFKALADLEVTHILHKPILPSELQDILLGMIRD
jgi:CheY-like chemotaxis protein